jgi:hypothetical protein
LPTIPELEPLPATPEVAPRKLKKKRSSVPVPRDIEPNGPALKHSHDYLDIQLDFEHKDMDELLECDMEPGALLYLEEGPTGAFTLQNPQNVHTYDADLIYKSAELILEYLQVERGITSIAYDGWKILVTTQ